VARRVSPVERIRAEIDQLFNSDRDLALILEDVARLSVRLVFQAALEAEVEEFLGRARYERRGDADRAGSRNGHQPPMTVKTTMGAVELQRPKLRGTDQAFCSRLFGAGVTRTNALESLVISGWVRGLSDRDIEATLAEVLGPEAALSKSTVNRICSAIREEFAAWRARDLSGVRLDYLFLDASHFKMHPGAPAEPVLAAWGIDTDGKPVLVSLAPAASESTDAWDDFLADLIGRGLGAPLLGISDGAAGLTGAFDRAFPASLRQRCLVHRSWKETRCRFPSLGPAGVVCAHAHTDGGPWSTRHQVRGLVAASERAPAALGVGGRGAAAGAWWRARGRAGRWRQRDDRPQGRLRARGRRGAVPARPRPPAGWGPQGRRPAGP
jgi:hypothetical protein